ncbi:hypothetical protein WJX73_010516 [Symbiochloris irregularis]|uniref:Uncharacterized protein n=1 Tax=Symbiochloris irregularis TaxID=706552 RepID=A0AAW1PIG3_9CHLO
MPADPSGLDEPNRTTHIRMRQGSSLPGSTTGPHDIRQNAATASPTRQTASQHCPATPPPSPVSTSMMISCASWPRDISPLDLTQNASSSAQKPPRGSPIAGRTASGRLTDSASSGPPTGLQRFSIPEALPVQVPRTHSNSALTALLPPILKAYPSQSSLQNMVSSSSGDMTGPLASSSMQDTTPRGTTMDLSLASSGLQHGSDSLDTPHAQGTRSAPPSPHAARHSTSSLTGDGSLHRQNSRVHGGVPAFAQHLEELSSLANGHANGQANGHPESLKRQSTSSFAQPPSPFLEFNDMPQAAHDREVRSRRGTDGQTGASAHSRNVSFSSTLDGSLGGSRDNSLRGNNSCHGNLASGTSLTPPPSPLTGPQV